MGKSANGTRISTLLHKVPWRLIAFETGVIATAVALYFLVRGFIHERVDTAFANAEAVVHVQRSLGVFIEPTLQQMVAEHPRVISVANSVYIYGHWPVIIGTLIWLVIWHRDDYLRLRNAILISGAIGLVIFTLFPVAPPRFLSEYGFVDTVTENTEAYRILQPPALTNQYAAIPSLHFGWNLLVGLIWARVATQWFLRLCGWVMPLLMLGAVILTANHYLIDAALGGAVAVLGYILASHHYRRRETGFFPISGAT